MRASAALAMAIALAVLAAGPATGQEPDEEPTSTEDRSIPDDAFSIVGTPDPGPKPEHSGDRGGWAQFLTLGLIVAGVGLVGWRIARGMRSAQAAEPG